MGSTSSPGVVGAVHLGAVHLGAARHSAARHSAARHSPTSGVSGILRHIAGAVSNVSSLLGHVFQGVGPGGLASEITKSLLGGLFRDLVSWAADGAASLVGALAKAVSATTEPALGGAAFRSEFAVMAVLAAMVALPLLLLGTIAAIARQDASGLVRTVLVRLPLALAFTGVAIQLVNLGLSATDQASAAVLATAGDPAKHLLDGLERSLMRLGGFGLAGFGAFLVAAFAAMVAFVLWLELGVRSAAIAAATLFLPLALAGLAWPATAHWARRLGETLAALVVSKLVIAAILALAASLLGDSSGVAGVVEGVALLAMAAGAPFALLKLVPVAEAGAIAHLEGLGRRAPAVASRLASGLAGGSFSASQLGEDAAGQSGAGSGLGLTVVGDGPFGSQAAPGRAGHRAPGDDGLAEQYQAGIEPPRPVGAADTRGTRSDGRDEGTGG